MSGRAKKTLYHIITVLCLCAAFTACFLMAYSVYLERGELLYTLCSVLFFLAICLLVSPAVLVHECGHLFFGACVGLKPVAVRVGWLVIEGRKVRLSFSAAAGETVLLPKDAKNVRRRMFVATLGGGIFNFIFGIIFSVLFFVLPANPILLFFELFAPLHLYEGIAALLPAQLPAGRTDGELLRQLKENTPQAQIFCNVLTVQGILKRNTFDSVEEALLFDVPVVREDDEAFLSLLHLRWQYLMWKGDTARAGKELYRLEELSEYLDEVSAAKVKCDAFFMRRIVEGAAGIDFAVPAEAEGSVEGLRARIALGNGNKEEYKKRTAQESAAGVRALESTIFERFIQNF